MGWMSVFPAPKTSPASPEFSRPIKHYLQIPTLLLFPNQTKHSLRTLSLSLAHRTPCLYLHFSGGQLRSKVSYFTRHRAVDRRSCSGFSSSSKSKPEFESHSESIWLARKKWPRLSWHLDTMSKCPRSWILESSQKQVWICWYSPPNGTVFLINRLGIEIDRRYIFILRVVFETVAQPDSNKWALSNSFSYWIVNIGYLNALPEICCNSFHCWRISPPLLLMMAQMWHANDTNRQYQK